MAYGQKSTGENRYGQKSRGHGAYGVKHAHKSKRGTATIPEGHTPSPTKMAAHEIGNFGMTHQHHGHW